MARKRKGNPISGWVNLDKPLGMGSTQAVGKVRWLFSAQKAGHAGTLDPLASGVLPIALGEATKTVPFMMDAAKGYDFTITWGENTASWDAEGEVTATSDVRPTRTAIEAALPQFVGDISQVPPKYSAIKVDGKRAYALMRGKDAGSVEFELKPRPVRVDSLTLNECGEISASFSLACGKGTYVRSLARDIAAVLGTCGHVTVLRRTRVGPFSLEGSTAPSFTLEALEESCHRDGVSGALCPVSTALDDIPVLAVTEYDANELKHGRAIALPQSFQDGPNGLILAKFDGVEIALLRAAGPLLTPKRVFNIVVNHGDHDVDYT